MSARLKKMLKKCFQKQNPSQPDCELDLDGHLNEWSATLDFVVTVFRKFHIYFNGS